MESVSIHYLDINDTTDDLCRKEYVAKVGSITIPMFFGTVVCLSLVGNILVLVIPAVYKTLTSLTNICILNLAVSDLLFTIGLPFWACYYIWGWTIGEEACKAVSFVFYVGFYSSILFLMLMTIQCYIAVVHPLSDWERGQCYTLIPIVAWVLSISAALPATILSGVLPDPEDSSQLYCEPNSVVSYYTITYLPNIFFICAFTVMSFCYIRILQTILKSRTNKRHRTIRLIFCIVSVFFVGWAPNNLVIFLQTLTFHKVQYFTSYKVTNDLDYALYVCQLLAYSHCCLNPVLYVLVSVKFRSHLREILQKIFQRLSNTGSPQPRTGVIQSQGSMTDTATTTEAITQLSDSL